MCDGVLEDLGPEPSIPLLSLTKFHGGNQLPPWNILQEDHKLQKSFSMPPMLLWIWQENDAMDLTLKLGTKQLQCNRLRLMCHSDYVLRAAANGHFELNFSEDRVTWEGLEGVCKWIKNPDALLERKHIIRLLTTAIFLEINNLVRQIWHCLDLANQFDEDQAFVVSQESLKLSANLPVTGLDVSMLSHIECFFLTIVASSEYVRLPFDHINCLFNSDLIAVNCEKEMFYAAVRWLTHDWTSRSKHVMTILLKIRFLLLPRKFILELYETPDEHIVRPLVESAEFKKIMKEVYLEHTFLSFDDGTQIYGYLHELLETSLPLRRTFICDDLCSYHRHYTDPLSGNFNYKQFLAYLRVLQNVRSSWKCLKPQKVNYKTNRKVYEPC